MPVSCECLCCEVEVKLVGLIMSPEETYQVWCVKQCDPEASTMSPDRLGAVAPRRKKGA